MLEHQKVSQIELLGMETQVDLFMFWSMEGTPKLELLVEQSLPLILISLTSTSELDKRYLQQLIQDKR